MFTVQPTIEKTPALENIKFLHFLSLGTILTIQDPNSDSLTKFNPDFSGSAPTMLVICS
jgi:hypothetical protein